MRDQPARLRFLARPIAGVAVGAVSWPADLVVVIIGSLLMITGRVSGRPSGSSSRRAHLLSTTMSSWERRRVDRWIGAVGADRSGSIGTGRAIGYLLVRFLIGVLSTVVLGLLLYGCWAVIAVLLSWLFGIRVPLAESVAGRAVQTATVLALILPGLVLLFLNLTGIAGVAVLDRLAATHWFRPSRNDLLQRRVDELTVSRGDLVRALDAERSRIERDLHDGVQQRVVALGLLVTRARRQLDPVLPADALLEQAQHEAAGLLDDLRDVSWRVSPATLESEGLAPALQRLAERASPPVTVVWVTPTRLPSAVQTCVFHVVSEAVTNVARHANAARVTVTIDDQVDAVANRLLRVVISDDGVGGALPRPGHGLAGLTGRVAALHGTLSIDRSCRWTDSRGGEVAVRVMIAEDAALLREGLRSLLTDEDHQVLAAVGDADQLLTRLVTEQPDLVIIDVRMPPSHTDEGIRAALEIRQRWPQVGIIVLSQYVETEFTGQLMAEGRAIGYLLKDRVMGVEDFLDALERVHRGDLVLDPEVVRRLFRQTTHADPLGRLTEREHEVLEQMAHGRTNAGIAGELYISSSAVEKHSNAIFDKLDLPASGGYSRRVLAVLQYLGS